MIIFFHSCVGETSQKLTPCSEITQKLRQGQAGALSKKVAMLISVGYIILEIDLQKRAA